LKKRVYILILLSLIWRCGLSQQASTPVEQDRFIMIEERLNELSRTVPGLNETVEFAVSGASIQEFLRGLATANRLNISIDPQVNVKIYNNFTNERVANILLFLAREYDLDIRFTGSIMSFYKYVPLLVTKPIVIKDVAVNVDTGSGLISMDLHQDSLQAVARKLTQITGSNVVLAPGLQDKIISVYLESLPIEGALEKMTFANELTVKKTSDNVYLIQKGADGNLFADPNVAPRGNRNTRRVAGSSQNAISESQENQSIIEVEKKDSLGRIFVSMFAANAPIAEVIQTISDETGINYFLFSEVKGIITSQVHDMLLDDLLTYLFRGTTYTFKLDKQIYLIGDRQLEGLRISKVFQFQYRSLDTMMAIIPTDIRKGVEIKEFQELNSILLTGSLPQISEIEAFLVQLDRVVPMVLIEVTMMDVRKGKSVSTGIKAGIADSAKVGGTLFPGLDFTFGSNSINDFLLKIGANNLLNIGKVAPNFYVTLSALEQNNNVEIRSIPKLSTLNGHDAKLSIGSTRYYSQKTQNVLGSLNPQTVITEQFNAVQANLAINLRPVVSGDDQVTLYVDVNISDFIGDPPPNAPPPTSTSQFKSMLRVRNEEMIVLGGLERTEKSENGSGVPFLSRIPVLKWLFSSRTRSTNKVVSIVFIKPTIIY
jgi:type IV pilus assembly protein PilQ